MDRYAHSPFAGQTRGRQSVARRTPSNGPRVVRANSVGHSRAPSPNTAAKRTGPSGLSTEELHCFDVLQMGQGGGIRIDEIVSPPTLRSVTTMTGARISEESDLSMYRGGMPYQAMTPVIVRIEGSMVHLHKLHDGRHLITLPCNDIKKIENWEGDGHYGLRLCCGSVSQTEVSMSINEKTRRTALHKLLMLKTRGVILPINSYVPRRSVSPSVAAFGGGWNRSSSQHDSRYDEESREVAPSPRAISMSAGGLERRGYSSGSPAPLTTSNGHSGSNAIVRSQTLHSRYGNGGGPAAAAIRETRGRDFHMHASSAPPLSEDQPVPAPAEVSPAKSTAEDMDRERRRQRIKQQLQERRAERARQQQREQRLPRDPHSAVEISREDTPERPNDSAIAESHGTPTGQITSPSYAPPDTDEAARRIVQEKRLQRQLHYEDMLEEERRLRMQQRNGGR